MKPRCLAAASSGWRALLGQQGGRRARQGCYSPCMCTCGSDADGDLRVVWRRRTAAGLPVPASTTQCCLAQTDSKRVCLCLVCFTESLLDSDLGWPGPAGRDAAARPPGETGGVMRALAPAFSLFGGSTLALHKRPSALTSRLQRCALSTTKVTKKTTGTWPACQVGPQRSISWLMHL